MSSKPPEEGLKATEETREEPVARQRCRYPLLQAVAAGAITSPDRKEVRSYSVQFALSIGMATGRELHLQIPRGCTGARLAQLLRQLAASIELHVQDCEKGGIDPRDCKAAQGWAAPRKDGEPLCIACGHPASDHDTVTQSLRTERNASVTAQGPRKAMTCELCTSTDAARHGACKRGGCPMATARALGAGIVPPGAFAMAGAPPPQWCGPCSTSYQQAPSCPACAALLAQHARMYGPAANGDEDPATEGH